MRSKRRMLTVSGLAIVAVAAITAGSQAAGSTLGGVAKPVIGPPVTVPKVPLAGKPMAVTFKVTRQDTGTPLTSGKMICDPSVEGKVIAHAESFRAGTARMAFTVPTTAAGKMLRVKVRIVSGTQAATKVSTFKVQAAAKPVVSIGDVSVAEGNAGTTAMSFPVTLSTPAAGTVTVAYATSDGTATTPGDYGSASGTLTFNAGEKTKAVAVNVVGDLAIEPDETFTVTLSNAVNASLGKATATGRITNDDTAVPVTAGEYKGATQNGNYVFFTVTPNRTVTQFRVNDLPETCSPYGRITGGSNFGSSTFTIRADGSFSAVGNWSGSDKQGDVEWTGWSAEVKGQFNGSSVTGTITEKNELNYKGTHITCTSGLISWTASLQ